MGADAIFVRQRHEHVIVALDALTPLIQFGIDLGDRPEQIKRLVDQMAADVKEQSAALVRHAAFLPAAFGCGSPAFQPGFKAQDAAELIARHQSPKRQAFAVPAPYVIGAQGQPARMGGFDHLARFVRRQRKRLVDHHCQPYLQRSQCQGRMTAIGRRDHHQIEVAGFRPQHVGVRQHGDAGDGGARLGLPVGIGRHHMG